MAHKIILSVEIPHQYPVTLVQTSAAKDNPHFMVVYGEQVNSNLDYLDAANELGSCIMHALCCAGEIINA